MKVGLGFLLSTQHSALSTFKLEAYQYCLMAAVGLCVEEQFQQADGLTGWRQWTLQPWCSSAAVLKGVMLVTENLNRIAKRD